MTDIHFHNAHVSPRNTLARRVARRLAFPFIVKLAKILESINEYNAQLQHLNNRIDQLHARIETLAVRQDDVEKNTSVVKSLHWDHVALAHRLAQLEDRLLDAEELSDTDLASGSLAAASFRFPGSERFEKGKAG